MSQTLFTEEGKQGIFDRIYKLSPQSERQWGKMNVGQMLAHCQKPLEAALNLDKIKGGLMLKIMSALFGASAKKDFIYKEELKKNAPTAPSFVIKDERDIEKEKQQLIVAINNFSEKGKARQLGDKHPFFGKMTHEEWDKLQWKHLDHHLKQFGV